MSEAKFDPSKRRLCPDGACIGVVGDDGRCRVCGRAGDGSAAARAPAPDAGDPYGADNEEDDAFMPAPDDDADQGAAVAAGVTSAFQASRRLCDDGSCIGVLGADGRCSVCGRAGGA